MTSKPTTWTGYSAEDLDLVTRTCLYVFTKLGDLLEKVVVVGGLVPYLLVNQEDLPMGMERHSGTTDLDLGLALAILDDQLYQDVSDRLNEAGFSPDVNPKGNRSVQRWKIASPQTVTVDFLISPHDGAKQSGSIFHMDSDFGALVTEGLELAFHDRRWVPLSGYTLREEHVHRDIPVCGPGAFTVLKALAFRNRGVNKDAYDLHYVLQGVGSQAVAQCLVSLRPNENVERALTIIREDFTQHEGIGPIRVAQFLTGGQDDEIQADVVGHALELLQGTNR